MKNTSFYESLRKPFFTPKPFVFSVVWPILYTLLSYLFLTNPSPLFLVHIALNASWSPVFFEKKNIGGALIVLLLMLCTAFMLIPTLPSSFLLYVIWITFAFLLNLSIYLMN